MVRDADHACDHDLPLNRIRIAPVLRAEIVVKPRDVSKRVEIGPGGGYFGYLIASYSTVTPTLVETVTS
jgi:hypothetical protein